METEILLDCLLWAQLHHSPPPVGSPAAELWWISAASDASYLYEKWDHNQLMMDLLCALYSYEEHISCEK